MIAAAVTMQNIVAFASVWVLLAVILGMIWHSINSNQPPDP